MSNEMRITLAILAKELELLMRGEHLQRNANVQIKLNEHLGTLPGFTMVDADNIGYHTPAIVVGEDRIFPLAIFEPGAWPRRPQYQQVVSEVRPVTILPDGTTVKAFKRLISGAKKDNVDAELLQKIFLVDE
ncbi:hypothetical protein Clacol_004656 [Clathrus columnatus]|uniref:Uncharacterized protein n=1 Tax=Clathrus columnatus TaxID=1419009 RepID=A0AAV5ABY5_9AGAM|nr:hypothetical protein Clacol_004656 [Clathrus columnatus]